MSTATAALAPPNGADDRNRGNGVSSPLLGLRVEAVGSGAQTSPRAVTPELPADRRRGPRLHDRDMPLPPDLPPERAESIKRLRAAFYASGCTQKEFAETVLIRETTTLQNWLSGKSPIPRVVQNKVAELLRKAARKKPPG